MSNKILPLYRKIISKFPPSFSYCFAYGSGVKKQLGYETKQKKNVMVDFVFVVDKSREWHQENLQMNPSHYSGMKYMGASAISEFQSRIGAGVYFNTLIPIEDEGVTIKYGVTSTSNLLEDLYSWKKLYLAGRLHKPVDVVVEPRENDVTAAIRTNLKSAVHAALLLLPEQFSDFELFMTIARLSYDGDFRMIFGENKNKVYNIVEPQVDGFNVLYTETLAKHFVDNLNRIPTEDNRYKFIQNLDQKSRLHHLQHLPDAVKTKLFRNQAPNEETLFTLANDHRHPELVRKSLRRIVWNSSVWQSIKNIPTAGVTKAVRYSWLKALKTFNL